MQYWRLLTLPGLKAVSRFQLIFAILMYLGSPAWMAMTALGIVLLMLSDGPSGAYVPVEVGAGTVLFAIMLLMTFAPKIASIIDVMLTPAVRRLFGGTLVFVLNILAETVFMAHTPVIALSHTIFLTRLFVFRRTAPGPGSCGKPRGAMAPRLCKWPQMLAGCTILAVVAAKALTIWPSRCWARPDLFWPCRLRF